MIGQAEVYAESSPTRTHLKSRQPRPQAATERSPSIDGRAQHRKAKAVIIATEAGSRGPFFDPNPSIVLRQRSRLFPRMARTGRPQDTGHDLPIDGLAPPPQTQSSWRCRSK
jgi:hypothetical protein